MYPVLFRIGTFDITSFGVMVAIGALGGLWVFGRDLARSGLPASAVDAAMAGVFGGLLGAKLLWVAEHLGEAPFTELLFSRGGMSWFGGLAGGIGTGLLVMWRQRIPIVAALAAATPALAIGHAIGRIGCFLVGDDYRELVEELRRSGVQVQHRPHLRNQPAGAHLPGARPETVGIDLARRLPNAHCGVSREGAEPQEHREHLPDREHGADAGGRGDIDFAGRFIEVRRGLVAGRITTPKNGKTRRVDTSAQLAETLRSLLTERKEDKLRRGWPELPEWVFCTEDGGPLDGDNLRHRVFYKVLEQAEFRRVRFHDLRHTFASLLIQDNVSLAYIKDQLGHSSIKITVDTYGHLVPGANRDAVDRLDDATIRNPRATDKEKGATA